MQKTGCQLAADSPSFVVHHIPIKSCPIMLPYWVSALVRRPLSYERSGCFQIGI